MVYECHNCSINRNSMSMETLEMKDEGLISWSFKQSSF